MERVFAHQPLVYAAVMLETERLVQADPRRLRVCTGEDASEGAIRALVDAGAWLEQLRVEVSRTAEALGPGRVGPLTGAMMHLLEAQAAVHAALSQSVEIHRLIWDRSGVDPGPEDAPDAPPLFRRAEQ